MQLIGHAGPDILLKRVRWLMCPATSISLEHTNSFLALATADSESIFIAGCHSSKTQAFFQLTNSKSIHLSALLPWKL